MKLDKQKALLFAVLGLALIAIIFGTSSIYADNQTNNNSAKSTAAVSVGKKNNNEKPKQEKKPDKTKEQPKKETPAPMASVKPAPVTELPQTGQFLHIGVTATGIMVLFLVVLIVLNSQFQTKLQKLAKSHEN
ncbi:hypothetical protein [Fructilactobacillus carniphilus]|uniref:Gram-positive cocci surface proteins LPxTG domain-containing protein n=1 Tax=Fructilactobacillus carniphilus TaxID=2940297 RepID=A0ABY5BX04_9LACO|nr:hypothetical protein [Fructilactobacillus carniphilus]USS90360.1 hypothetical protein M3M37_05835 [Fructilactobacillus carniphilus]